ncbi:MAG TPA: metal-dependent hydrolase, partial [Candidatus Acidoferrales bacterium]|nr:metal-dependent hydrolase [Candidatus Acidoferrales bacterium]
MDTFTHAFAGALLGKALFSQQKLSPETPAAAEHSPAARAAIWSVTLASAFPDIDVFYDIFSRDDMATLKYHRYVTHSFLCMPLWALGLAWLTRWVLRRFGVPSPTVLWLWLCYLVGIASHILLDLATSFGTMCWSPLSRARPSWDILFIVDFCFTAIVLLPQVAAWIARNPENSLRRALRMWALFVLLTVGAFALAESAGVGFAPVSIVIASGVIGALFFLSAGWPPLAKWR